MSDSFLFQPIPAGAFEVRDYNWLDASIVVSLTEDGNVVFHCPDYPSSDRKLNVYQSPGSWGLDEARWELSLIEKYNRDNLSEVGDQLTGPKRRIMDYLHFALNGRDEDYRREIAAHAPGYGGDRSLTGSLDLYLDDAAVRGSDGGRLEFFEAVQAAALLRQFDVEGDDSFSEAEIIAAHEELLRKNAVVELEAYNRLKTVDNPPLDTALRAIGLDPDVIYAQISAQNTQPKDPACRPVPLVHRYPVDFILSQASEEAYDRLQAMPPREEFPLFKDIPQKTWEGSGWHSLHEHYEVVKAILASGPSDSLERFQAIVPEGINAYNICFLYDICGLALLAIGPEDAFERFQNLNTYKSLQNSDRDDPSYGLYREQHFSLRVILAMGADFKPWMTPFLPRWSFDHALRR